MSSAMDMCGKHASVRLVSLKQMPAARKRSHRRSSPSTFASVQKRVASLQSVKHPNVVGYYCCSQLHGRINVYMEPWGESVGAQVARGVHGAQYVRAFLLDVMRGLFALHQGGMTHGDVKPDNILYAHHTYKLCDCDDPSSITANYMSAARGRVWPRQTHDQSSDVHSVGMSAMEVLCGETPYAELEDSRQVFFRVCSGIGAALWADTTGYEPRAVASIDHVLALAEQGLPAAMTARGVDTQLALITLFYE